MTDPLTGAATIVGLSFAAKPALDLVKDFLGRVLAPTGDAVGQSLAHPIVEWQKRRVERASKLVAEAATVVAESGQEPQPVPGRLLMPILEKGSLEEDEELHQRWVALLANAALNPTDVPPSFVTILAELSPVEAKILESFYNRVEKELSNYQDQSVTFMDLQGHESPGPEAEQTSLCILFYENVVEQPAKEVRIAVDVGHLTRSQINVAFSNLARLDLVTTPVRDPSWYENPRHTTIKPTLFGRAFISTCSRVRDDR